MNDKAQAHGPNPDRVLLDTAGAVTSLSGSLTLAAGILLSSSARHDRSAGVRQAIQQLQAAHDAVFLIMDALRDLLEAPSP